MQHLFDKFRPYPVTNWQALPCYQRRCMSIAKPDDARRVVFEHPHPAHMMAIDGTWRRACTIRDVSEASATLQVESSIEGLALKEFFLLLSSTGLAYRRCALELVNGGEIRVTFLKQREKRKKAKEQAEQARH